MKSVHERRAAWVKPWLLVGGVGAFTCAVACGGVDETRSPRSGNETEAGAPASSGGSSAIPVPGAAGEGSGGSGGSTSKGEAGQSAGGAIPATPGGGEAGANDVGEAGASAVGEGGAAGSAGASNTAGAGPDEPVVDPVCGVNKAQVGAVSEWCGKVNVHLEGSSWVTDKDCTSGCRNDDAERLAYCKKFYPKTASIVKVSQVASGTKDWKNAGCYDSYPDGPGISGEFACCAPAP